MVQVSYPGVYVVEVPSGVRAIVPVSTSIAAFFGRTSKGPIHRAVRIQDRATFTRTFGAPLPSSDLPASVNQFFNNGGSDCYVVRIAHNAAAANLVLRNVTNAEVLEVIARDKGLWGNNVRLEVDYNTGNPDDTFNLRVMTIENGDVVSSENHSSLSMNPDSARFAVDFVNSSSTLIELDEGAGFNAAGGNAGFSEARRPFDAGANFGQQINALLHPAAGDPVSRFDININDAGWTSIDLRRDPAWAALANNAAQGTVATQLRARINSILPAGQAVQVAFPVVAGTMRVLRITANSGSNDSVRIRRSPFRDFATAMMLGVDQGGIEVTRHSIFRPAPNGTVLGANTDNVAGNLNTLATIGQPGFDRITINGHDIGLLASGAPILQTTAANDPWYKQAPPPNANGNNDGVREKLRILATAINQAPPPLGEQKAFRAELWGNYHLAFIPVGDTHNGSLTVASSLMAGGGTDIANLFTVNTRQYALGPSGTSPFQAGPGASGADSDGNPLDAGDYIGNELAAEGFYALDQVDIFNLMVLPADEEMDDAKMSQVVGPASIYCSEHRAFLLIDAPATDPALSWVDPNTKRPNVDASKVNALRSLVVKQNSAVYFPRIIVNDRGKKKPMGASGTVAGIMARIDPSRGIWKAPAGTEADVRGILDLEVKLSDREQGILNKVGANALRSFPSGFAVWGARTLAGTDDDPNEWKYVPVRRFALFLEESLYRGTRWIVFEPNDEPLWANIRKNIRAFMMGLFRLGAFQGSNPEQAFYVKCDSETTTEADRNLGIVNIEVGFAPLKPAEFVIIRIQQIAPESE